MFQSMPSVCLLILSFSAVTVDGARTLHQNNRMSRIYSHRCQPRSCNLMIKSWLKLLGVNTVCSTQQSRGWRGVSTSKMLNEAQMLEAEAEAKFLASRPVWPRGFNITGQHGRWRCSSWSSVPAGRPGSSTERIIHLSAQQSSALH